jgi:hypothetical protein
MKTAPPPRMRERGGRYYVERWAQYMSPVCSPLQQSAGRVPKYRCYKVLRNPPDFLRSLPNTALWHCLPVKLPVSRILQSQRDSSPLPYSCLPERRRGCPYCPFYALCHEELEEADFAKWSSASPT